MIRRSVHMSTEGEVFFTGNGLNFFLQKTIFNIYWKTLESG